MSCTGLSAHLSTHRAEPYCEIHSNDALKYGIQDGELVEVRSEWGQCNGLHNVSTSEALLLCERWHYPYRVCPSMTDGALAKQCFSYQNALAERINGILKQEFLTTRCQTMKELDHLIAESIMIYNCYRPHLSLNMNTPNQTYEQTKTELIA